MRTSLLKMCFSLAVLTGVGLGARSHVAAQSGTFRPFHQRVQVHAPECVAGPIGQVGYDGPNGEHGWSIVVTAIWEEPGIPANNHSETLTINPNGATTSSDISRIRVQGSNNPRATHTVNLACGLRFNNYRYDYEAIDTIVHNGTVMNLQKGLNPSWPTQFNSWINYPPKSSHTWTPDYENPTAPITCVTLFECGPQGNPLFLATSFNTQMQNFNYLFSLQPAPPPTPTCRTLIFQRECQLQSCNSPVGCEWIVNSPPSQTVGPLICDPTPGARYSLDVLVTACDSIITSMTINIGGANIPLTRVVPWTNNQWRVTLTCLTTKPPDTFVLRWHTSTGQQTGGPSMVEYTVCCDSDDC